MEENKAEWVAIEALLKKGEYPIIADLLHMAQDLNTAIYANDIANERMKIFKTRIDKAVAEHTELKIEKRLNPQDRRFNGERRNNNVEETP